MAAWIKLIFGTEATLSRDVGVVTTRTQSNEFRVVTSSNEYLSPRNIVIEYLSSNDYSSQVRVGNWHLCSRSRLINDSCCVDSD